MKINREIIINGVSNNTEYELTGVELERAYNEYVERHDKDEVVRQLKDMEYEDLENIPEEIIADLASQVREKMEDYRDQAIISVIQRNEELLAPYKEAWKLFEIECTQTRRRTFTVRAKNDDDADRIFEEWRDRNTRDYDYEMSDAEIDDEDIGTAYEVGGNPDYAEIKGEDD